MPHTNAEIDRWVKQIAQYAADILPTDIPCLVIIAADGCETALISNLDDEGTRMLIAQVGDENKVDETVVNIQKRQS